MKYQKLLATLVCASLLSFPSFAKPIPQPGPLRKQEEQKLEKELEQKALAMLDELIEEAASFKLPENRVRILSLAADMLWRYDEKRARALFGEAMNLFGRISHLPEDAPDAIPENFRWQLNQMRQELVQMIAAHDAQLASDFLVATRPDAKSSTYNPENEAQLELMLAQQIARQDPKKALQAAKEKLAAAKNPGVVSNVLAELRQKDAAAAQELADAIVAKLRAEGQLSNESASYATNLLNYAPYPSKNGEAQEQSADQSNYLITPTVARELIEKAFATAQANLAAARKQNDPNLRNNAVNLMNQLKSTMPYIEKYAPASVAALKRGVAESEQLMDVGQRRWNELNTLAEKGSPDLLIEAAAKAGPEMQYSYYQRAAQIAREKGSAEQARQLINEHVPEGAQRQQALREIDQQTLWQNINNGKYEDARGLMAKLWNVQERVNALTQMAGHALNSGKKGLATQFLDEAWAMVEGPAETNQQFNAQLQIAGAYIKLNSSRSFEIIEATLDQYNELFAASALLENFDQRGTFRDKEMILNNGGGGRATQYLWQYGQHLMELSRTNMERVQTVIGRLARPEVRASVRLTVLQQLLRGPDGHRRGIPISGGMRGFSMD